LDACRLKQEPRRLPAGVLLFRSAQVRPIRSSNATASRQ
jgi:hypothetical protein